ncbi:hypothetical protein ElyMa_004306100, partial [Elysia marginata]
MSSRLPLLIANQHEDYTERKIKKIVYRSFEDIDLTHVWLDPIETRRAIALIDVHPRGNVPEYHALEKQPYLLAWADPATSLLVNTNGISSLNYGTPDKLKMLFTMKKRGGSSVEFVKMWSPLDDSESSMNYFEIGFVHGWDAVLKASCKSWTVEGENLTLLPLFPCFQEDLETQILKLPNSKQCIHAPKTFDAEEVKDISVSTSQITGNTSQTRKYQMKEDDQTISPQTKDGLTSREMVGSQMARPECFDSKSKLDESFLSQNNIVSIDDEQMDFSKRDQNFGLPINSSFPNDAIPNGSDNKTSIYAGMKGKLPALARDILAETHFPKSEAITDQSIKSGGSSASLLQKVVYIKYSNPFLGWLLSVMEYESSSKIIRDIDQDKKIICFQSEDGRGKEWVAALEQESSNISMMPDYEEFFLMAMRPMIQLSLEGKKLSLSLDQEQPQLLLTKTGDHENNQMRLGTWIKSLIAKESIPNIPEEWFEDESYYNQVKEIHPCVKFISCKDERSIKLLALSWDEAKKSLSSAARDLKNWLVLSRKSLQTADFDGKRAARPGSTPQYLKSKYDNESSYADENFESPFEKFNTDSTLPNEFVNETYSHANLTNKLPGMARDILAQTHFPKPEEITYENHIGLSASLLQKVVDIKCSNLFLGWLLSVMEYESSSKIITFFDPDKEIFCFQSEDERKEEWLAALEQESYDISQMPNYVEKFLISLKPIIHLSLEGKKLSLSMDQKKPQLLLTKTGDIENDQMRLQTWIKSLIARESIPNIPEEWFEDESCYSKVKELHTCVEFISCKDERSIKLLALSWDEAKKSLSSAARDLKNLLVLSRISVKTNPGTTDLDGGKASQPESTSQSLKLNKMGRSYPAKNHGDYFMKWHLRGLDFLKRFLWREIEMLKEKYHPLNIHVEHGGLKIQNAPWLDEVKNYLLSLQRQIKCHRQHFIFPMLQQFLQSEGQDLLNKTVDKHQCLIFFPGRDQEMPSGSVDTLELTSSCYHGIFLGTARKDQQSIHLVQGEPEHMDVDMIVAVTASTDVHEATIERCHSRDRLVLNLPEWSSPKGIDCHDLFEQQRQKLQEAIRLVFQQAAHFEYKRVAIFTNGMRNSEHANFPAEDFADAVGCALWTAGLHDFLDVYICDTSSSLIFKAFDYIFARRKIAFRLTDERDWEVITTEETSSVPDYNCLQKNRHISVNLFKPGWSIPSFPQNELVCLPVTMFIDHISIPFIGTEDQRELEKIIFRRFSDGLLAGQTEFFSLARKQFLVYCCPPWGFDADKTLGEAMTSCFHKASSYQRVHFVPPLGYPEHYVAHKVFQSLDTFTESIKDYTSINIWVQNHSQQKMLDAELNKRKSEQKGFFSKLMSFLPDGKQTDGPSAGIQVIRSHTPKTVIGFTANNDQKAQEASGALLSKLSDLMKQNTQKLKLNRRKVRKLQDLETMVKNDPRISAELKYQVQRKNKGNKNRQKRSQGFENIDLVVSALTKDLLAEFLHSLQMTFGVEIFSRIEDQGIDNHKQSSNKTKNSGAMNFRCKTEEMSHGEQNMRGNRAEPMKVDDTRTDEADQQLAATTTFFDKCDSDSNQWRSERNTIDDNRMSEATKDELRNEISHSPEQMQQIEEFKKSQRQDTQMQIKPSEEEDLRNQVPFAKDGDHGKSCKKDGFDSNAIFSRALEEKSKNKKEDTLLKKSSKTARGENTTDQLAFHQPSTEKRESLNETTHNTLQNVPPKSQGQKGVCSDTGEVNSVEHLMEWESVDPQTCISTNLKHFQWMFKSESGFTHCDPQTNEALEEAYSHGKTGIIKIGKGHVDLNSLTAKGTDKEKELIRVETFDSSSLEAVLCPQHWCKKNFRTVDLETNNGHYKNVFQSLKNGLKSFEVEILKIEALENPHLFKKYRCKQKQLLGVKDTVLWHRVSLESKLLACQYGLHYNFMEIPP